MKRRVKWGAGMAGLVAWIGIVVWASGQGGCVSPKDQAQSEIANVSDRAKSIENRSQQMAPELPAPLQKPNAENIEDAKQIQASSLRASAAVGNTENPETGFQKSLRRLTVIVVALAVMYVLFKLTPLLKPLLNMVGLLIPKVTRMDAKFDAEAVVSGTATQHQRESIAANRVADRAYDREFRRQKRLAESNKK